METPAAIRRVLLGCLVAPLMLSISVSGCEDAPFPTVRESDLLSEYSKLAQAVALTLSDPTMRRVVIAALGDSPYERQAQRLSTVLEQYPAFAGELSAHLRAVKDGAALIKAAASPNSAFVLVVPSIHDRDNWAGTDDIVVAGIPTSPLVAAQDRLPTAYDVTGTAVEMPTRSPTPFPVLLVTDGAATLRPSSPWSLSPDPAPGTISARRSMAMEYAADASDYTPLTKDVGYSMDDCITNVAVDADSDGIDDDCEVALAEAFYPMMSISRDDRSSWERESYWEVDDKPDSVCTDWHERPRYCTNWRKTTPPPSIFYGFGYYDDPGYRHPPGSKLKGAHPGDSEFVVVFLEDSDDDSSTEWTLNRMFFSAHYRALKDQSRMTSRPEINHGRPVTWVAERKHANFPTRAECDGAGILLWKDSCSGSYALVHFDFVDTAKFSHVPWYTVHDWDYSRIPVWPSRKDGQSIEAMQGKIQGNKFCGWQVVDDRDDCSGGYHQWLTDFDFLSSIRYGSRILASVSLSGLKLRGCGWEARPSNLMAPFHVTWSGVVQRNEINLLFLPKHAVGNSGWLKVKVRGFDSRDYAVDSVYVTAADRNRSCRPSGSPPSVFISGPSLVRSNKECTWTARTTGVAAGARVRWEGVFGDTVTVADHWETTITGTVKEDGWLWASLYPAYHGSSGSDSLFIRVDDEQDMFECDGEYPV